MALGVMLMASLSSCGTTGEECHVVGGIHQHRSFGVVTEVDSTKKILQVHIKKGYADELPSDTPRFDYGRAQVITGDLDSLEVGSNVELVYLIPAPEPIKIDKLYIE